MGQPDEITLKEAADILGVGRNRMSWLLREGYVVGRKIGGRGSRGGPYLWLVDRADLLEKQAEWERDGYPWVRM